MNNQNSNGEDRGLDSKMREDEQIEDDLAKSVKTPEQNSNGDDQTMREEEKNDLSKSSAKSILTLIQIPTPMTKGQDYPYFKKFPVLSVNNSISYISLYETDIRAIHLNTGFNFITNQQHIKYLFPWFAMWGLETNYIRARDQILDSQTFGHNRSQLFQLLNKGIKTCMEFINSASDAITVLDKEGTQDEVLLFGREEDQKIVEKTFALAKKLLKHGAYDSFILWGFFHALEILPASLFAQDSLIASNTNNSKQAFEEFMTLIVGNKIKLARIEDVRIVINITTGQMGEFKNPETVQSETINYLVCQVGFGMEELLNYAKKDKDRDRIETIIHKSAGSMVIYKNFYQQFFLHKYECKQHLKYNIKGWDVLPYEQKSTTAINPSAPRHSLDTQQSAASSQIKVQATEETESVFKNTVVQPNKWGLEKKTLHLIGPQLNILQIFKMFLQGSVFSEDLYNYIRRFVTHSHLMPDYLERRPVIRFGMPNGTYIQRLANRVQLAQTCTNIMFEQLLAEEIGINLQVKEYFVQPPAQQNQKRKKPRGEYMFNDMPEDMTLELAHMLQVANFRVSGDMVESFFRYRSLAPIQGLDAIQKPVGRKIYLYNTSSLTTNELIRHNLTDQDLDFSLQITLEKTCKRNLIRRFFQKCVINEIDHNVKEIMKKLQSNPQDASKLMLDKEVEVANLFSINSKLMTTPSGLKDCQCQPLLLAQVFTHLKDKIQNIFGTHVNFQACVKENFNTDFKIALVPVFLSSAIQLSPNMQSCAVFQLEIKAQQKMKIYHSLVYQLGAFLKKVIQEAGIDKTLVSFYACLDFYAMMQQVSYLKQFSIWITFQPQLSPTDNIRLLASTNVFKQLLCKQLHRSETDEFFTEIIKRSSNTNQLTKDADKFRVAYLFKKCILASLQLCKRFLTDHQENKFRMQYLYKQCSPKPLTSICENQYQQIMSILESTPGPKPPKFEPVEQKIGQVQALEDESIILGSDRSDSGDSGDGGDGGDGRRIDQADVENKVTKSKEKIIRVPSRRSKRHQQIQDPPAQALNKTVQEQNYEDELQKLQNEAIKCRKAKLMLQKKVLNNDKRLDQLKGFRNKEKIQYRIIHPRRGRTRIRITKDGDIPSTSQESDLDSPQPVDPFRKEAKAKLKDNKKIITQLEACKVRHEKQNELNKAAYDVAFEQLQTFQTGEQQINTSSVTFANQSAVASLFQKFAQEYDKKL